MSKIDLRDGPKSRAGKKPDGQGIIIGVPG